MFHPLKDPQNLPYSGDSIVKVYRGMNMVNVSIGDFTSEPAEVYITTSSIEDSLGTYIVFYLVAPETRAIYEYDNNPFPGDDRINVESEAKEFVEEMGVILEDIGWEAMNDQEKANWLEGQYLISSDKAAEPEEDPEDVVELTEDAIMDELPEDELEIIEEAAEPEASLEQIVIDVEDEDDDNEDDELDDISEDDSDAVFIEEKFDELLKKAFLKSKESENGADEGPMEDEADLDEEPEIDQEAAVGSESEEISESTVSPDGDTQETEAVVSDGQAVLKFLSKF